MFLIDSTSELTLLTESLVLLKMRKNRLKTSEHRRSCSSEIRRDILWKKSTNDVFIYFDNFSFLHDCTYAYTAYGVYRLCTGVLGSGVFKRWLGRA